MSARQLLKKKANLFSCYAALLGGSVANTVDFYLKVSFLSGYVLNNLFFHLLFSLSRHLQSICYQINRPLFLVQRDNGLTNRQLKWGIIIYDFTRENWLQPVVNSLFLSPLFLLTVRGNYNLSSRQNGSREYLC
jgi:hypothetical protein